MRCTWKGDEYWHPGELTQEIVRILYEQHCRGEGPIHYLDLMKRAGSLSSRMTARLSHCFKGTAAKSWGVLIVESPLRGYYWMNPEIDIPPPKISG